MPCLGSTWLCAQHPEGGSIAPLTVALHSTQVGGSSSTLDPKDPIPITPIAGFSWEGVEVWEEGAGRTDLPSQGGCEDLFSTWPQPYPFIPQGKNRPTGLSISLGTKEQTCSSRMLGLQLVPATPWGLALSQRMPLTPITLWAPWAV